MNNAIIQNITAFLEDRIPPSITETKPNTSKTLISTIQLQDNIGWIHWFYGRHKMQWGHLFNHEIDNDQPDQKNITPESWDREIILLTREFTLNIWNIRKKLNMTPNVTQTKSKTKNYQTNHWNITNKRTHALQN
jgi:hypothetical protein